MAESNSRLTELFLALVAVDGASGQEKPVAEFIRQFLSGLGLDAAEDNAAERSNGNSGNIICRIGTGGDTVYLAHMDTVRSTKRVKPQIINGRITSSGDTILGADDRAGVALLLHAVENLVKGAEPPPDFTVVFTVCEETSLAGSTALKLPPTIRAGYALDSSNPPGHFINSTYGAQQFQAHIIGRASHSALDPQAGINAIKIAAQAIQQIPTGLVKEGLIVNIAMISGGEAVNAVPEHVTVDGELRSSSDILAQSMILDIKTHFQNAVNRYKGRLEFDSYWSFRPYAVKSDYPAYIRLEKAISAAGLTPVPQFSPGGSDANSLNAKGIPALNLGIGAQLPHSNSEFILVDDLSKAYEILINLIKPGAPSSC